MRKMIDNMSLRKLMDYIVETFELDRKTDYIRIGIVLKNTFDLRIPDIKELRRWNYFCDQGCDDKEIESIIIPKMIAGRDKFNDNC